MAEVDGLNGNLEQTIEDYNYANLQLANIDRDLTSNAKHLVAAKKSLVVAQTAHRGTGPRSLHQRRG